MGIEWACSSESTPEREGHFWAKSPDSQGGREGRLLKGPAPQATSVWNLQGALTLGSACLGWQTYLMRSILPVSGFFLAAAFAAAVQPPVRAEGPLGSWTGAWLENDLVVNTDRHYTHGTLFSHLFHEHADGDGSGPDRVASHLPAMGLLGVNYASLSDEAGHA